MNWMDATDGVGEVGYSWFGDVVLGGVGGRSASDSGDAGGGLFSRAVGVGCGSLPCSVDVCWVTFS